MGRLVYNLICIGSILSAGSTAAPPVLPPPSSPAPPAAAASASPSSQLSTFTVDEIQQLAKSDPTLQSMKSRVESQYQEVMNAYKSMMQDIQSRTSNAQKLLLPNNAGLNSAESSTAHPSGPTISVLPPTVTSDGQNKTVTSGANISIPGVSSQSVSQTSSSFSSSSPHPAGRRLQGFLGGNTSLIPTSLSPNNLLDGLSNGLSNGVNNLGNGLSNGVSNLANGGYLNNPLSGALNDLGNNNLASRLGNQLSNMGSNLGNNLGSNLGGNLGGNLNNNLGNSLRDSLRELENLQQQLRNNVEQAQRVVQNLLQNTGLPLPRRRLQQTVTPSIITAGLQSNSSALDQPTAIQQPTTGATPGGADVTGVAGGVPLSYVPDTNHPTLVEPTNNRLPTLPPVPLVSVPSTAGASVAMANPLLASGQQNLVAQQPVMQQLLGQARPLVSVPATNNFITNNQLDLTQQFPSQPPPYNALNAYNIKPWYTGFPGMESFGANSILGGGTGTGNNGLGGLGSLGGFGASPSNGNSNLGGGVSNLGGVSPQGVATQSSRKSNEPHKTYKIGDVLQTLESSNANITSLVKTLAESDIDLNTIIRNLMPGGRPSFDTFIKSLANSDLDINAFLKTLVDKQVDVNKLVEQLAYCNISVDRLFQLLANGGVDFNTVMKQLANSNLNIDQTLEKLRKAGIDVGVVFNSPALPGLIISGVLTNPQLGDILNALPSA